MLRILFGDTETYLNKFKTCVRCRKLDEQILGADFYEKEHSKPLFEKHKILTVQNLYSYHTFMETFKLLKFRMPSPLYNNYSFSRRQCLTFTRIIPPKFSDSFTYRSACLWNSIQPKLHIIDLSANTFSVKNKLRNLLHNNQHKHDKIEWLPSHDFNVQLI